MSAYEDYMKAAQLYMDGKTDMNAVEKSKQKLYDNFIEVYKAAGNSFENPTDEKKKDAIFCNDTIDGVFKRSIWSMINALNKPSDEKNYADAAAQFAYRAYGFSGDQYNYIVSSIDKQFMEIIKMEMMYQEFIAQRGDYFEEKYPDDESKWESYAAWTNDLNKLNEDVAKAMDTMLDREILVSDSTVGSIRMKLDEFVKPEDMVSVRMKNENYHEKLTGEFYENEQPIIDAFNEGYLYLIEEYGWKSNADVITPFINFHRIAVPTPKTEENPSGIDIYYIFDTSQPHDAEEDWAWNSDDSVPENLRFYQFEEKIDLTLARDQHIPSCDFINLTKENYSDGQNQFSCAKNTAEFQSLRTYVCKSCGGEIVGDANMAATSCPFCDNPIVMMGQFAGALKPDLVIPFKLDKKAAKEGLKKHLTGKRLLPKIFKDQNHIDEIKGIYVPFWLFDTNVDAAVRYRATKVRMWSDSDYDYTETSHFMVHRGGSIGFENVPVDGSTKMADDLMESIEPFNISGAVDFQTAYLAGYLADKYDVTAEQSIERANKRVKHSTEEAFAETVKGYATVTTDNSSVQFHGGKAKYALYPVWLLNTTWNGNKYTFAMNGQTGKFVGDLPVDKGAAARWTVMLAAVFSVVTYGAAWLLHLIGLF